MEFFAFTLENGIRCILEKSRSPVVHCALTVNAGSRDECADEHGMAHFVEHSLFKGTDGRRAFHINSRLENLGGELNAFTTKEDTTIHATTLKSDFSKAAELIADIVFHSTFPEHEIEREKQVVIDEINSYRDIPQEMLYDQFEKQMFGASILGRNILGTARSVGKFSPARLKSFVARTYTPDQMVFAAVGNVSRSRFTAICERWLGNVPAGLRGFSREMPPPLVPFEDVVAKGSSHQSHCIMGGRAYPLTDPLRLPLSLLVNILGGPAANSRLNTLLRERNGLSYSVEAIYSPFSDTGFAGVYFSCERDKLERCRDLVDGELRRIMSVPLTTRQLSMAKKQFLGQFAISMDSGEGYMLGAAKSFLIYNEIDSQADVARKVEAITAEELTDIAREIFSDLSSLTYR